MTSVTRWHTGRLWLMTLSASLQTEWLCVFLFFFIYPIYYKKPFLDLGKNIVKWLGQCFLPELATRSFLLNPKYDDSVPLCLKIRPMDGNGAGDICGTTVRNKRVFFWMRWLQRS